MLVSACEYRGQIVKKELNFTMDFAIIVKATNGQVGNVSCAFFNKFRKVEMLDSEYSLLVHSSLFG